MTTSTTDTDFWTSAPPALEDYLHRLFPALPHGDDERLQAAARYAVFSGGKRLRPLLCLSSAMLLGATLEETLAPAAALELVHCYSLVHDDLPAMDNDDHRRGKPTLHRVYPEGHAILTGDYLLTYAFEVVATAPHLDTAQRLALVQALAQAGGIEGLVGGQGRDLSAPSHSLTTAQLEDIHRRKTGRLFETALLFGAVVGRASTRQQELLTAYGRELGIAFQIADDLLDAHDAKQRRGAVGSDQRNGKATFASMLHKTAALERLRGHQRAAAAALAGVGCETAPLRRLLDDIVDQAASAAAAPAPLTSPNNSDGSDR